MVPASLRGTWSRMGPRPDAPIGTRRLTVKPYDPLTLGDQVVEILGWGD